MRVTLIQPPTNFLEQAYGVRRKVKFGHAPPLGLGYIASYLEQDGHAVDILDAGSLQLTIEETVSRVEALRPDLVGMTVLTNYRESAGLLAEKIKERVPGVTTVLGGAHATYFFEQILDEMPGFDHVAYGEADTMIREYVRYARDPEKLRDVKGLVYRGADGKAVINPPAPLLENLDEVPMPAWHLFDMSLYRPLPLQYRRLPFFTMITSRGCWWRRCKFCFQAGYCAVKYRRQSPQRVVDEMEVLHKKHGIREIAFWDDTFLMGLDWLRTLAGLLKERKLDITWVASGRINTMNEDIIRTVAEAGCWSIFMGIESGNQELLDIIDKGITLDQARKVLPVTKKYGMETRGAFMLGLPGETPEMARKTVRFALELDPTYAIFYATHPRFGTELYDIAMRSGKFIEKEFKGMSKVTYVPEGYRNAGELERMVRAAYLKYYVRPRYILKTLLRIRTPATFFGVIQGFVLFLGLSNNRIRRKEY
jgi:anaerobic magnesium-protoporphyrin IX monomethyl ester cyclase